MSCQNIFTQLRFIAMLILYYIIIGSYHLTATCTTAKQERKIATTITLYIPISLRKIPNNIASAVFIDVRFFTERHRVYYYMPTKIIITLLSAHPLNSICLYFFTPNNVPLCVSILFFQQKYWFSKLRNNNF